MVDMLHDISSDVHVNSENDVTINNSDIDCKHI